jgi:hypothetical protein
MKTMLARQLEATLADPERLLARAAFADDLIVRDLRSASRSDTRSPRGSDLGSCWFVRFRN